MNIDLSFYGNSVGLKTYKDMSYIFDVNNQTLPLYFGLKNKHNYHVVNKEDLVKLFRSELTSLYDIFIIPESSSNLLKDILKGLPYIEIKKNDKQYIKDSLLSNKLCKDEKVAINKCFDSMGLTYQAHKLKANKRKLTEASLFNDNTTGLLSINRDSRIALLDDLYVTGGTFKALGYVLNKVGLIEYNKVSLFLDRSYKQCLTT